MLEQHRHLASPRSIRAQPRSPQFAGSFEHAWRDRTRPSEPKLAWSLSAALILGLSAFIWVGIAAAVTHLV
jgi:hypothetical protein